MVTELMWNESLNFLQGKKNPEPPGKQREASFHELMKRLNILFSSVAAKKSLFVSGEFLLRYRAVRPPAPPVILTV